METLPSNLPFLNGSGGCTDTRFWLIVLVSAFLLVIVGAVVGNLLESRGTLTDVKIGSQGLSAFKLAFFALFCVISFAVVPVAVRLFIFLQIKIGNGGFFLVQWFRLHEQAIICGGWIFLIIGFGIIFGLGGDDVMSDFR